MKAFTLSDAFAYLLLCKRCKLEGELTSKQRRLWSKGVLILFPGGWYKPYKPTEVMAQATFDHLLICRGKDQKEVQLCTKALWQVGIQVDLGGAWIS